MTELEKELLATVKAQKQIFKQEMQSVTAEYQQKLESLTADYKANMNKALKTIENQERTIQDLKNTLEELPNLEIKLNNEQIKQLEEWGVKQIDLLEKITSLENLLKGLC